MRALNPGKHVVLEKTCTSNAKEARAIFNYAKEKNLALMEGYHHRSAIHQW